MFGFVLVQEASCVVRVSLVGSEMCLGEGVEGWCWGCVEVVLRMGSGLVQDGFRMGSGLVW